MLDNQIVQLSSEDLDKFFEAAPEGSPNADTLTVGKENSQVIDNTTKTTPKVVNTNATGIDGIPMYDDSLDEPIVAEVVDPTEQVTDTEATKTKDTKGKAKKDTEVVATDDAQTTEPTETLEPAAVNTILKNTVEYLVKAGKWVDFEGREDLEVTEEVYADLAAKQDEYRLSQLYNELLDSTGDYGKAIIAHVKSGGNPDEIIDLFKEQKQLENIDTSTETGKLSKIEKYYSDILGWKPERVEKTIKRLVTDNEVDTEFSEVENLYDEHYKEQLAKTQARVKEQELENQQKQAAFANGIKTVLKEDPTLTEADRRMIQSAALDFKHKLPNGQKVNDFYIKFAEKQADPKEYVDLMRFVLDKEGYLKSIKRTEQTKANVGAFSFIKGGAALTKTTSTPIEINANPAKVNKGTDFSFALKK